MKTSKQHQRQQHCNINQNVNQKMWKCKKRKPARTTSISKYANKRKQPGLPKFKGHSAIRPKMNATFKLAQSATQLEQSNATKQHHMPKMQHALSHATWATTWSNPWTKSCMLDLNHLTRCMEAIPEKWIRTRQSWFNHLLENMNRNFTNTLFVREMPPPTLFHNFRSCAWDTGIHKATAR